MYNLSLSISGKEFSVKSKAESVKLVTFLRLHRKFVSRFLSASVVDDYSKRQALRKEEITLGKFGLSKRAFC